MPVPDFSNYTEAQLRQALTRIDAAKYPERVREIEARLADFEAIAPLAPGADDLSAPPVTVAGPLRRIGAFLIDVVLLGVLGWIASCFMYDQFAALGPYGLLIGFVVMLAYFGILESRIGNGQSVGKRIARLRVVGKDGAPPLLPAALCRTLIFCIAYYLNGASYWFGGSDYWVAVVESTVISAVVFSVPYLVVCNRRTRQSLHDLATGTYVVHAGPGPLALPNRPVWRGHIAILGAVCAAMVTGLFMLPFLAPQVITAASYEHTARALAAIPGLGRPAITQGTFTIAGRTITTMSIQVPVAKSIPHTPALAKRVVQAVLENVPQARSQQQIAVILRSGYDIGIVRGWTTTPYTGTPQEWRDRLAAPKE